MSNLGIITSIRQPGQLAARLSLWSLLLATSTCNQTSTRQLLDADFLPKRVEIVPRVASVAAGNQISLSAINGAPPYVFRIEQGLGTLVERIYTAPSTTGFAAVSVTDANGLKDYAKITITESTACPTGYLLVKANPSVGTTHDFCIAKYEMKCADSATGKNCQGPAISQAANLPYRDLKPSTARNLCNGLGGRYNLMTHAQRMTIARSIESNAANWSSGVVGTGSLSRGHDDMLPDTPLEASTDDNDGCFGTGQTCSSSVFDSQRRTHVLADGSVIWDFSGNISEYIDGNLELNRRPYSSTSGHDGLYRSWSQIDTFPLGNASYLLPQYPSASGIGNYASANDSTKVVSVHGDSWRANGWGGIYSLDVYITDANTIYTNVVGLRCAYTPYREPEPGTCPPCYIRVPANPEVGTTKDFCVARKEMGFHDGAASACFNSVWLGPTQSEAKSHCANLGSKYHLMSLTERTTIARNIESVAANWDTGVVSSGQLNRGHTDDNPATVLSVEANTDNDPCMSITGIVGSACTKSTWHLNRRTHKLTNGSYIWDFSGNAYEWLDLAVSNEKKAYRSSDGVPTSSTDLFLQFTDLDTNIDFGTGSTFSWFPKDSTLLSANGVGRYRVGLGGSAGLLHGSAYNQTWKAGIYALTARWEPTKADLDDNGFRCVKDD
jgi:hypothetical protein